MRPLLSRPEAQGEETRRERHAPSILGPFELALGRGEILRFSACVYSCFELT